MGFEKELEILLLAVEIEEVADAGVHRAVEGRSEPADGGEDIEVVSIGGHGGQSQEGRDDDVVEGVGDGSSDLVEEEVLDVGDNPLPLVTGEFSFWDEMRVEFFRLPQNEQV